MAPQAQIVIRPLESLVGASEASVPKQALSNYFRSWGVDVTFEDGLPLGSDPTLTEEETDAFCLEQAPTAGASHWPAALVIGEMSTDGSGTNGILLDLKTRGACAVFTRSFGFRNGSADDRFEVFAHEIGHLLNLTHGEADETFPTAMNQWDERSMVQDRVALWSQAITAANATQRARLRSFYGDGSRHPLGLPMSTSCCDSLAGSALSDVEPWGTPFKDDAGGALDIAARSVICDFDVQTERCSVAQPLDFSVQFKLAPGVPAGDIPTVLDIRSGSVQLHITSPDGRGRVYQGGTRTCGELRRRIRPGQVVRRNYSLLGDINGLVFPVAGTYQLGIVVPRLDVRSLTRSIAVLPAADPFANASFRAFLGRGLPAGSPAGWRTVDAFLQSESTWESTKAHLATKALARGVRPLEARKRLRAAAAPRILEKDALLRIFLLRRSPSATEAMVHRAIDDAERVFRKCDTEHPTLEYLTYVRRHMFLERKRTGSHQ